MSCRTRRAIVALVVLSTIAACSSDKGTVTSTSSTLASATTSPASAAPSSASTVTITAAPTTLPAVATAAGVTGTKMKLALVATATAPLVLATRAGTTTMYVAERAGRVRTLTPDGTLHQPILDISSDVTTDFEKGLLGLAFSPDGGLLYASYTDASSNTRIDEFHMSGEGVDMSSRRIVLQVVQPAGNHNGGNIVFGSDGFLWFGLGDGGGSGDQFNNAQNLDTLLGSILRIDPRGRDAGAYSVPPDNPFVGKGGRPEIWLYGVRNPWRWSFDRATGDLWIGDVGQNLYEEIDHLPAPTLGRGANLQWPLREGTHKFRGDAPAGSIGPVFDYDHSNGSCSITGGYVYRGTALPSLAGAYLFGDYCEGIIYALVPKGSGYERVNTGISVGKGALVSFGQDSNGELYTLALSGAISKLVPA